MRLDTQIDIDVDMLSPEIHFVRGSVRDEPLSNRLERLHLATADRGRDGVVVVLESAEGRDWIRSSAKRELGDLKAQYTRKISPQ